MEIGLVGYFAASIGYLVLGFLIAFSWQGTRLASLLLATSFFSLAWAALSAVSTIVATVPEFLLHMTEFGRNISWCYLLLQVTQANKLTDKSTPALRSNRWFLLAATASVVLFFGAPRLLPNTQFTAIYTSLSLMVWVTFAIVGLSLVEQLYRNARAEQKWSIKYICIGLGLMFAYDFYLYSDALLFRRTDPLLWEARGFVNALAIPLIAISIARNPGWNVAIHVSRKVVFHSATLLGAGVYLLAMSGAGYFVRYYGGTWGGVLQVTFLCAAGILLLILLFSDRIRTKMRVFISKHFFSYKYDYREEWLKFTQTMANSGDNIQQGVTKAIARLVNSEAALLFTRNDKDKFVCNANWNTAPIPFGGGNEDELIKFVETTGWIIDLDENERRPDIYQGLKLSGNLQHCEKEPWLIVPLLVKTKLIALIVIMRSNVSTEINWEDRDLLKMAAHQAGAHLSQYLTDKALIQARQFEAFNQLSAYVVHDLKNILAQQSLILANADKHKQNPDFIADVFTTISNSVARMTRLMEQMKSGKRGAQKTEITMAPVLNAAIEYCKDGTPMPSLECATDAVISADEEQLITVFTHILQNAQQATDHHGKIDINLQTLDTRIIIEVRDNGCGMTPEFIDDRLFKPFQSTKGLTGMGIGLFESREYLRSIDGDIFVESTPGEGSVFRIVIPCATKAI